MTDFFPIKNCIEKDFFLRETKSIYEKSNIPGEP